MEGQAARGEKELDMAAYGAASDRIGRLLQRLGIRRTMRDVSHAPADLRGYLESVEHDPAESEAAE